MSEHTQNLSSCCALCGIKNDKKNLQSYKFSTNANKFKEIIRDERDFEVEKPKNFCYSCRKLMGKLNKRIHNPDEMIKVCDDLRSVKHQFDPHSPECFVCRQFQAAPGAPAAVVGPAPGPAPAGNSSLGHEHFVGIKLEDNFQCVMCDKVMFDPRVTSCGHIYCHPCLLALQQETTACWLHLHQDNNALIKIRILMTVPNFLLNWNGLVEWRY